MEPVRKCMGERDLPVEAGCLWHAYIVQYPAVGALLTSQREVSWQQTRR